MKITTSGICCVTAIHSFPQEIHIFPPHSVVAIDHNEKEALVLIYGLYLIVLLQVGLDGIRMLDPSTSRTLRIYPLDSLTRWEVSWSAFYYGYVCIFCSTGMI